MANNDDLRINKVLPVQGDRLKIPGLSFPVTVIRLDNRGSIVDGNGEPVVTIYFKGSNRTQTALLSPPYITSLDLYEILPGPEASSDEETDEVGSDKRESVWENLSGTPDLGKQVRKYFDGYGWYNGKVHEVWTNGETKKYTIFYDEDDDAEEMDESEFKEWSSYFAQKHQPNAPLALVRARAQATAESIFSADDRAATGLVVAAAPAADAAASFGESGDAERDSFYQKLVAFYSEIDASRIPAVRNLMDKYADSVIRAALAKKYGEEATIKYFGASSPGVLIKTKTSIETKIAEDESSDDDTGSEDRGSDFALRLSNEAVENGAGQDGADFLDEDDATTAACLTKRKDSGHEGEIVVYNAMGRESGIGCVIAKSNDSGLGFNNPFDGISSFGTIRAETGKANVHRSIHTENHGGWISIYAKKPADTFPVILQFPESLTGKLSPSITLMVAEISIISKDLSPESLMRGHLYNCKERQDGAKVVALVHAILQQNSDGARFFGGSLVCVSLVIKNRPTDHVLFVPKTAIRDRTCMSDAAVLSELDIDADDLRIKLTAGEAQFAAWIANPVLNNSNVRKPSRGTGAFGAPYQEEPGVAPNKQLKRKPYCDDYTAAVEETIEPTAPTQIKKSRKRRSGSALKGKAQESALKGEAQKLKAFTSFDWDTTVEDVQREWRNEHTVRVGYEPIPAKDSKRPKSDASGISPASMKVREDLSASTATNAMHERLHLATFEHHRELMAVNQASVNAQLLSIKEHATLSQSFIEEQATTASRNRVAAAFGAFSDPTPNQASMFQTLVQHNSGKSPVTNPQYQISSSSQSFDKQLVSRGAQGTATTALSG